jgi:hypothetical protein
MPRTSVWTNPGAKTAGPVINLSRASDCRACDKLPSNAVLEPSERRWQVQTPTQPGPLAQTMSNMYADGREAAPKTCKLEVAHLHFPTEVGGNTRCRLFLCLCLAAQPTRTLVRTAEVIGSRPCHQVVPGFWSGLQVAQWVCRAGPGRAHRRGLVG